ncbi:hypothetical protein ACO0SA_000082 [Hanseniaspora valbyensis]
MRTRSKSITLAENNLKKTTSVNIPSNTPTNKSDEDVLDLPKIRSSVVNSSTSGAITRSHSINTASTTTPKRRSIFSSIFGGSSNKTTSASTKKKLVVDTKEKEISKTKTPIATTPTAKTQFNSKPNNTSEDAQTIYSVSSIASSVSSSSDNSIIQTPIAANKIEQPKDFKKIVQQQQMNPKPKELNQPEKPLTYDDMLKNINTKRVAFKVQTFTIDPPQQIPGRNPRKGLKLLPYELSTSINIDEGIASGNNEKPTTQSQPTDFTQTKDYRILVDQHSSQLKESMAHQQSSYFRARKLEQELEKLDSPSSPTTGATNPIRELLGTSTKTSSPLKSPVSSLAESIQRVLPIPQQQQQTNSLANQKNLEHLTDPLERRPNGPIRQASEENIIIDMPIHRHHSFVDELPTHSGLSNSLGNDDFEDGQNSGNSADSLPSSPSSLRTVDKNVSLDKIYTRCCHLREILPIPITLKQLKNKKNPLQVLKFLNPKPTLVDILSFTDFIQCIDLKTLVFDNVSLTDRMVTIIFKAVAKLMLKNQLEKLCLKNVIINKENWKLLCKIITLSGNAFQTLDVSQTKLRKELQDSKDYLRSEMDWDLFWYVIDKRKERILKINKPEIPYHEFNLIYFNSVTPGAKYSLPPPPPEEKEKEKEKMRELKRLLKEQQQKEKEKQTQKKE